MKHVFECQFLILSLLLPAFVATPLLANERAHEHGVGTLSIAVEGNEVEIEMVVPGADVVGFEHPPSSDEDRTAISNGEKKLRQVSKIINLSVDANCRAEDIEVSSGLIDKKTTEHGHHGDVAKKDAHNHNDEHNHKHEAVKKAEVHDDHKHEKNHDHSHKSAHKDDHGDSHKDGASHDGNSREFHAEFVTHYHFHCDNPEKLVGASLGFFAMFPSAHELDVKWVTPRGQGAKELSAKAPSVSF